MEETSFRRSFVSSMHVLEVMMETAVSVLNTELKQMFPLHKINLPPAVCAAAALDSLRWTDYLQQFSKFIHTAVHTPHHNSTINTPLSHSYTHIAGYMQKKASKRQL